jgi:NAD(P)-dependent dehydrogenase (short-subunit alcohol dehydrogenase family)
VNSMAGQQVAVIGGTSGMSPAAVRAAAALGAEVIAAGGRPPAVLEVSGGESLVNPLEPAS